MPSSSAENLQYQLRCRDFAWFHCVHPFLSPTAQFEYVFFAFACGYWLASWGEGWGVVVLGTCLAFGLAWILQFAFCAVYLYSRRNRILARHELCINQEGLVDTTSTYVTLNRWSGIVRIRDFWGVVVVYTGPVDGIIIPRKAFANAAARADWIGSVQQCLRKHV